jgi:energy-coupling factor transporter ATP-binding protein EcfA2
MRYTYFQIRNFKGIDHVRLSLSSSPKSRVHTLIGLNESGKTTILEAINLLSYRESLDALNLPGYAQQDVHELIPIAKRSNFNEKIVIEAGLSMDDADYAQIRNAVKKQHGIVLTAPIPPFSVTQNYQFKDSRIQPSQQPTYTWSIQVRGRATELLRAKALSGEAWQKVVGTVRSFLPRIVYFPNFLFEFPDKIYLENPPSQPDKHTFYQSVLQDVLDAIGEKINLQEHVLNRAKSGAEFDKKSLDSVLLKMGGHITKTVFSNWNKIFKKTASKKEIVVFIGTDNRGACYLQLRLKQGSEYYEISERSLGFRWFFTYLLLTQYRGFRQQAPRSVVFLLDEPASNLHPSAQAQLLDSFQSLPDGCHIVYTTHSHHMIKPEWLEGAFVVRNEGLDYGEEDQEYTSRRTLITLHKYREFAAKHPNQTTYFQPVLDVLDYCPARLENVPDVVMVEGKNDFYTLMYVQRILRFEPPLALMPGSGAGSLSPVIRLYVGWGRNFVALLDSDAEGNKQRNRYVSDFGPLVEDAVLTLGDLRDDWKGKGTEKLFTEEERLAIQRAAYPTADEYHKTHFARAIQELTLTNQSIALSSETASAFRALLTGLQMRLSRADSQQQREPKP